MKAIAYHNYGSPDVLQCEDIEKPVTRGDAANAVELRGRSPVIEGGSALAERDWLVTIARPDGDLTYMVFVSPEPDFAILKPVYSAMAQSFRAQ